MELCVRCSKLHQRWYECSAGHATLSQTERDFRNEAQRMRKAEQGPSKASLERSPASRKAHIPVSEAYWVLAEQRDDDHPAYYAVSLTAYADDQEIHRSRGGFCKGYAIVSVRTPPSRPHRQQGSGIQYECSRAACRTVAFQRLASHPDRVEPCPHIRVVQLRMQLRDQYGCARNYGPCCRVTLPHAHVRTVHGKVTSRKDAAGAHSHSHVCP